MASFHSCFPTMPHLSDSHLSFQACPTACTSARISRALSCLHPSVLAALSWWEACFGPPAPGKVTSPYISKDTSGKPVFHFLGCLCILSSVCLATTNIQYKYGRIRVHVGTTFQLYWVSHLTRGMARPFLEPWVPWAPWTRVRQLGAVLLWHRLKLWFKLWFSAYLVKWEDDLWS